MQDVICQAIREQRLLTVHQQKGDRMLERVVEPYALYPTATDELMLESRLVEGDFVTTPPPRWCPLPLHEITGVTLRNEEFTPDPTYNHLSLRYQRAICRLTPNLVRN